MATQHIERFFPGDTWAQENPVEYAQQKAIVWAILRKLAEIGSTVGRIPRVTSWETDREKLNNKHQNGTEDTPELT